jgi:Flp pilus assembly protein TadD
LGPPFQHVGLRLLRLTALALFLLGEGAGSQQPASTAPGTAALPPQAVEAFNQGVQALNAGQLEVAEKAFLRVLKEGGKVAYVYNNLGIVYERRGKREQALAQFRQAIRLEPDYAAPRALMGSLLLAMGKTPEAARELAIAVKLQPKDPLLREQLAKAYGREEDYPRVLEQLQVLEQLAPQEPEYVYQSARAYLDLSAWCYREIVHLQPNSARAYQTLAENFRAEGRPELAMRAFQHAVQADPTLPEIHLALAEIYFEQGKKAEARKELEQELAIVPESASALALERKLGTQSNQSVPQP